MSKHRFNCKKFRKALRDSGMSQAKFASRINASKQLVGYWAWSGGSEYAALKAAEVFGGDYLDWMEEKLDGK